MEKLSKHKRTERNQKGKLEFKFLFLVAQTILQSVFTHGSWLLHWTAQGESISSFIVNSVGPGALLKRSHTILRVFEGRK